VTSTDGFNQLLEIDTDNPTDLTVIAGPLDVNANPLGIGMGGGMLWIYDTSSNVLRQIDRTGMSLATVDLHLSGLVEGDLAFNADGNSGFLVSSDGFTGTLVRFELPTGNTSVIATDLPLLMGLTLGDDGFLYGLAKGVDPIDPGPPPDLGLYKIDPLTGVSTLIGTNDSMTCYDGGGNQLTCTVGGLTYSGGVLYGVVGGVSQNPNIPSYGNLFVIDPQTGAAVNRGQIGFFDVSGITADTPEPAAWILTLSGLALIVALKRRS
jgi:hypothetical protein